MKRVTGFTLIELLLVLAILAILTALVLPKLDGLQSSAGHAVGAAGANDTGRFIQIFRSTKQRFPDGWDTLLKADGTPLTPPAGALGPAIHTQLYPNAAGNSKLKVITLSADNVTALFNSGIVNVYNWDGLATSTKRPGDRFTAKTPLAANMKVMAVNAPDGSNNNGRNIIDHIYRKNLQNTADSGKIPTGKMLVVFGFGPQNDLIAGNTATGSGNLMLETPYYPNVDPTLIYNRNLVVFEMGETGTSKIVFKGVLGTDGDLIDDMAAALSK